MKKFILFIFVTIVIIASFAYAYYSYIYTAKSNNMEKEIFESYLEKEISGTQLASIINKVIDLNKKNGIQQGTNGINNNINSIDLEVLFIDNDKVYNIYEIYNGGINNFVQYYGQIRFKCNEIKYHKNKENISKIIFSQIE